VDGSNAGIHAFHAALVPIIFVLALMIAHRAWSTVQAGDKTPAA
jgi:hypothetical protein